MVGHPLQMILLRSNGDTESFEADAPPLGVLDALLLDEPTSITLEVGDTFLIPTDGIFEAMDESGQMYGVDRMIDILKNHAKIPLHESLETLRSDMEQFRAGRPAQDDRTILAIRRTG